MIQILVNNEPIELLELPPKEVFTFTIINIPSAYKIQIPTKLVNPIKEWLYNITQMTINQIIYNGVILQKSDIIKPTHL